MSHHLTKRLYWIQARAQSAIDGDEKWRDYDYPRNRNAAQESLRRRYRESMELLKLAKCPDHDCEGGAISNIDGWDECQWCAERKELIGDAN